MTPKTADEAFRELVGIAIGEASTLFMGEGGVFNSTRASKIVDEICAASHASREPEIAELKEKLEHEAYLCGTARTEIMQLKQDLDAMSDRAVINGKLGFEFQEERDKLTRELAHFREALEKMPCAQYLNIGAKCRSKQDGKCIRCEVLAKYPAPSEGGK